MALPYGYCNHCASYNDLRTTQLKDGTHGYTCTVCSRVFDRQGKPAEKKGN